MACLDSATADGHPEDDTYSYWKDSSTLSKANMELASTWTSLCLSSHNCCGNNIDCTLPTRIIHIKGPQDLALEDGGNRCLPYLTLSYKWGEVKKYCSLTENIADHKKQIPFEVLPKTFQDAVFVTHCLGFEYLWIDALCIIHDSPEDLQKEISQMGSIYRASTLTLFAEAGDHAEAGLSVSRDPRSSKPCRLDLRATFDSRTLKVSTYACYDPFSPLLLQSVNPPLYQRGWVLQEEILAPRLLKFGARQIKWECRNSTFWESLPDECQHNPTLRPKYFELRSWMHSNEVTKDFDSQKQREMFKCWCELIENYCKRSLTYANDALPAIAGIASIFSKNNQLSYANGLWKEDLPLGLLWFVKRDEDLNVSHPRHLEAVNKPNAPSWTWLAQWGKSIEFEANQLRYWAESYTTMIDQLGNSDEDRDETFRLQDQTPFHQGTSFQTVDMRPLSFRGHLIKGNVELSSWSPLFPDAWGRRVTTHHTQEEMGILLPDSDPFKEPILKITCCLCIVCEGRHNIAYLWLALVPTGQLDAYKRVGMGRLTVDDKTQDLLTFWRSERKCTFSLV